VAFISDFRDLKSGDYVVHVDHGIGRFDSLQTIEAGGASREFMLLSTPKTRSFSCPSNEWTIVSRYSSGEATAPGLDRLGGLGWQKTKAKAKRAMRDMADELLRLYADANWSKAMRSRPTRRGSRNSKTRFPSI
jgi:transcription-repair coupling factor (superfamily II helicase)